jgi:hypothetical protein
MPTLKGLFKSPAKKAEDSTPPSAHGSETPAMTLRAPSSSAGYDVELPPRSPRQFGSSRNSFSATASTNGSFMEDIKHEVMANWLYQQQCGRMWVSDGSGDQEGTLLRKNRGLYIACPPALAESLFAQACTSMGVKVRMSRLNLD